MDPGKILIIDDEANIRRGLQTILAKDSHDVREASSAEEALTTLETFACEAAIVDIRLPGMTGDQLLPEIRARWPAISVVLLTGHGTLETAMTAVKEGAFDYLLKPTQAAEIRQTMKAALVTSRQAREQSHLFAAIRGSLERIDQLPGDALPADGPAIKGRANHSAAGVKINNNRYLTAGDLVIDLRGYQVRRGGEEVALTPSEFQLLAALASRAGEVINYVTLVRLSLEYEAEPWEAMELIKRHVFSLRQKIEPEPSSPRYILNVRGIGYRLAT
jgi:DNA-binding response OmpR family regulator